ncbi:MAG: hypothetical protein ACQESP_07340 [Candidatus Muiribacteriota bacterium]
MYFKKSFFLVLLLTLTFSFNAYSEEEITLEPMMLTLEEVRSHTTFVFEELGFSRLAGLSGPRFDDDLLEKAVSMVKNFLEKAKNDDGKLKAEVYTRTTVTRAGNERSYHYVIIHGPEMTLNEFTLKNGITFINQDTKDFFDIDKMKELENKAKENKLLRWAD